ILACEPADDPVGRAVEQSSHGSPPALVAALVSCAQVRRCVGAAVAYASHVIGGVSAGSLAEPADAPIATHDLQDERRADLTSSRLVKLATPTLDGGSMTAVSRARDARSHRSVVVVVVDRLGCRRRYGCRCRC